MPAIEIVDRTNRSHRVDLNNTAFFLQKKVIPIYEALDSLYLTGGDESLNEGIRVFVSFLQRRCALHLADDDRDVEINFGFDQDQLILLDPGRLFYDPSLKKPERVEREMRIASKRLRRWLSQNYPQSAAFLDQQIEKAINEFSSVHPARRGF